MIHPRPLHLHVPYIAVADFVADSFLISFGLLLIYCTVLFDGLTITVFIYGGVFLFGAVLCGVLYGVLRLVAGYCLGGGASCFFDNLFSLEVMSFNSGARVAF